jgi:hypothetical protein
MGNGERCRAWVPTLGRQFRVEAHDARGHGKTSIPRSADVIRSGLYQPTIWLSWDAETMWREGWTEADIEETQTI